MTLPVPGYLASAHVDDESVRYEWDDWRTLPAAETPDPELVKRLKGVSQRAVLAFLCGTAEWIYARLGRFCEDPAPGEYLEAAWAIIIDSRYVGYGTADWWQTYSASEWLGPVKGPIHDALAGVETAAQQLALERIDPSFKAARLATLSAYIMPDPKPYIRWRDQIMDRFERVYPRRPEDPLGDVVPRQAIDPGFDFRAEDTEALINRFLTELDHDTNRFLSSPEGMLKGDVDGHFMGTPYRFDIEADRQARLGIRTGR